MSEKNRRKDWLLDIAELRKEDIALVGGKGANLGEMTEGGFPVPPGFVISTLAFTYFLEKNSLTERLDALIGEIKTDLTDSKLSEASTLIRGLFDGSEIPVELASEINTRYDLLGRTAGKAVTVAVRSSATAEDLPTASFAGQQDTYLNISGKANVLEKVRRCWSSLFTPRAIAYRISKGFDHDQVKLAVVVQEMIDSDISGVMFTLDPTASTNYMMIEAGFGQGEAIVSGKVTPDTYLVDRGTHKIADRRISIQKWKLAKSLESELVKVDLPLDDVNKQKMPDDKIIELAMIGSRIERHYGGPMDIEWCMADGRIYVVQARPVTTLGSRSQNTSGKQDTMATEMKTDKILVKGLAASPGTASGNVRHVADEMNLEVIKKGDIMVTKMTTPDMVPA
ncbi:MAG: PEP/pyruvate-binding domain-containing protein, partial [Methanomassiliicoccales archaeon]